MSAATSLRRIILLVAVAAAGGAVWAWLRDRNSTPVPANPPEWPPLATPPATTSEHASTWRPANPDGSCPDGFPVKAKASSGIYHLPGGRFHERTNADRCYADAAAAEADGYRRSKS